MPEEAPMLYTLLIYQEPGAGAAPGTAEAAAQHGRWMDYTRALEEAGALRGGEALQGLDTATTVRERDGEVLSTDGPFAETKEMLAGFYLVDVEDLDAALSWAARMPNITYGSVEVRPVMTFA
jgi:hypothetical protein